MPITELEKDGNPNRLPFAARGLIAFWAVLFLATGATIGTLAWLGPLPQRDNRQVASIKVPPAIARQSSPSTNRDTMPNLMDRPLPAPLTGPHLALALSGFGYSASLSEAVLTRLPTQIGLVISPTVPGLRGLIDRARASGHEVFLDLPVEGPSPDETSPGPYALGYSNSPAQDMAALERNLADSAGLTGISVADPMIHDVVAGPGYAATPDFRPIAMAVARRGMLILESGEERSFLPRDLRADNALDLDTDGAKLDEALATLSRRAKAGEYVLTITTPVTPAGLDHLATWCSTLAGSGIQLVPPSRMLTVGVAQNTTSAASIVPGHAPAPLTITPVIEHRTPALPPALDEPS